MSLLYFEIACDFTDQARKKIKKNEVKALNEQTKERHFN